MQFLLAAAAIAAVAVANPIAGNYPASYPASYPPSYPDSGYPSKSDPTKGGNNGGDGGMGGGDNDGNGGNGGDGGNGGGAVQLCPASRVPQCCQLSVLGVADVTCDSPSSGLTSVTAFQADCAGSGTTAQCCLIPVAGLGLFCNDP